MRNFSKSGPISGVIPRPEGPQALGRLSTVRWSLLVVGLVLAGIGAATIHSASSEMAVEYLPRQLLWIGLGLGVSILVFLFDYRRVVAFAVPFYLLGLVCLALVLVAGVIRGGARSWLGLAGLQFQPAELAKLTTALLLARYVARAEGPGLGLRQIGVASAIVGAPVVLIAAQPDLGSAAMFLPMLGVALFLGGLRLRVMVVAGLVAIVLGFGLWSVGLEDYQKARIVSFASPGSDPQGAGYQVRQSKIAVGSGELTGKGFMQGTQSQLRFLPARHTDFVFAVLAEEWGFAGVATTLGLYAIFLAGLAEVAFRARDRLGVLLVGTLFATFAFHLLYNTAMVVGLVPITGIPLPFLSYGGSFTLFCFAATGLVLGIDFRRYVNR